MDTTVQAMLSELRERVRTAHDKRRPLRLRGSGTKDFYGEDFRPGAPANGASTTQAAGGTPAPTGEQQTLPEPELLDLRSYTGIVDYEPSELFITARCGTPLVEIEAALAQHNQFLAFEPPAFGGDPTLGGVIAAGLSGPRRMYSGAARDFVLGATLLDGKGEILRFGGQVMKNVAGFDVSRLLCGSLGILGVITEVSLKVLPKPRVEQTIRFALPAQQAVEAFNRWSGQPLPISGASWYNGTARVRLSGASSAVRAARERMGGTLVNQSMADEWWNSLRHHTHAIFNNPTVWRLSVPDTTPPLDLPDEPLIDWGGALRWYATDAPETRKIASAAGGTALCWQGTPPAGGRFHPLKPAVAALHRRLKERFDPHGIFNPGRMIAGI